jgi:hypothetical protein
MSTISTAVPWREGMLIAVSMMNKNTRNKFFERVKEAILEKTEVLPPDEMEELQAAFTTLTEKVCNGKLTAKLTVEKL